jgi:hypothetical protein
MVVAVNLRWSSSSKSANYRLLVSFRFERTGFLVLARSHPSSPSPTRVLPAMDVMSEFYLCFFQLDTILLPVGSK